MIPYHIAIIMDGNGRWAKERFLPRTAGHKEGAARIKEILKAAPKIGIKSITIFAFSTENWDRPKDEIDTIFSYMHDFLSKYEDELMRDKVRLKVIGRRTKINGELIKKIERLEELTKNNENFFFNIALDYGGRWDIIEAAKKISTEVKKGNLKEEEISEQVFKKYIALEDFPDPDLLVRTSGEERISNFLLWNLAYSELYFPKVNWPDFTVKELEKAIEIYNKRERRFGKL